MILTWDEYQKEELKFDQLYFREIKHMLKEEQVKFIAEYKKGYTFKVFFKEYAAIAVFIFVIAFMLYGYGVISFDTISVCTFLAFVVYTFIYDRWQSDIKLHAA